MPISVPNNTRFCVNFTFSAVSYFSFNIVSSEVQKHLYTSTFPKKYVQCCLFHHCRSQTPILFVLFFISYLTPVTFASDKKEKSPPPQPPISITPSPPFSPSLISSTVSVDVKHHVYARGVISARNTLQTHNNKDLGRLR